MSDLISRKALINTIKKNCYPIRYDRCSEEKGMTITGIMQAINEQPTAFDLESVIEDFENKLECTKLQLEVLNIHADKDSLSVKNDILFFRERAERYEEFLEILKSATNATNGKNGG